MASGSGGAPVWAPVGDALPVGAADDGATVVVRVAGAAAPRWTRWLAAALIVQAVAQAAAGVALWQRLDRDERADYRTLSSVAPGPAAAIVRMVPAAGMAFAALRGLLARHRLAIVETSAGGDHLGLAAADGAPIDTGVLLQRLRTEPGVLMAEPIAR